MKITGEMGEFRRDPLGLLERLRRDQGDVAHVRFGLSRIMLFSHPSAVEEVLVAHNQYFRKNPATRRLGSLFGRGLLSSDGDAWLRKRRLTQPAFHRERVTATGDVMVDYAQRLVDGWNLRDGQTFDVQQQMMELTLQIACKTLFGAEVAEDVRIVREAMLVVGDHFLSRLTSLLFLLPDGVPTPGNWRYQSAVRDLDRLVYRIINERDEDRGDLLSMLLAARATEDGGGLSDREIRDEVMTFFLAGHETTALALAWAHYLLSRAPAQRARLFEEIDSVLQDGPPGVDDVARLPYTRAVVDEALRLYPPAYLLGRQALRDCTISGHTVKRGTTLLMSQWLIHRDSRFFDQPSSFLPERWLDGTLARRLPRFAYFPFGGGQRQCIGNAFALLEAHLVLATIAQRAQLDAVSDEEPKTQALITLRPKYGIPMRVSARAPLHAGPLISVS